MRKLLVAGLLLAALIVACETKTPVGPASNTPTTSTTTSTPTTSPTTSTSTTTTIPLLTSLVRSFKAFPPPPPNVPNEMTLFYQLITSVPVSAPLGGAGLTANADVPGENKYRITGVYVMGNGTTGTVTGELGGAVNPVETGGTFTGSLTAKTTSGCTADRPYLGPLGNQSFTFTATGPGTATCSPSPMAPANSINMLLSDPGAPLPTPPPTSSSTSTSTTTSICSYSLSPPSGTASSSGGPGSVTINTQSGCGWSAQSFADWITVLPPFGGSGQSTVTYTVAANPASGSRTGRLLIAGIDFLVTQSGAGTPDLVPFTPLLTSLGAPDYCRGDGSGNLLVMVRNNGTGNSLASETTVAVVLFSKPFPPVIRPTPVVNAMTTSADIPFPIPAECFSSGCNFTITVNSNGAAGELAAATANNSASGVCLGT